MPATGMMDSLGTAADTAPTPLLSESENPYFRTYWLLWTLAGFCTLFSVTSSVWLMRKHMVHYSSPHLQRSIVRIILLVPIYAVTSFLSLWFVHLSFFLNTIRDCYEALALYEFMQLMIGYAGGSDALNRRLSVKSPIEHPWPFASLPKIRINRPRFLLHIRRGVLQFVVVKPILAISVLFLDVLGVYKDGDWSTHNSYSYIYLMENFSVCVSLYCLVIFYKAAKEELDPFDAVQKFLCVKCVIFFTFWQGFILSILIATGVLHGSGDSEVANTSSAIQNFLVCVEMCGAAIMHRFYFPYEEFITTHTIRRNSVRSAMNDIFTVKDVLDDTRTAFLQNPQEGPSYTRLDSLGDGGQSGGGNTGGEEDADGEHYQDGKQSSKGRGHGSNSSGSGVPDYGSTYGGLRLSEGYANTTYEIQPSL
eukprot:Nk52_evm3s2039 gene=Nk52_evmTU3s2039